MWHIASQVTELKKVVIANKDILMQLRSNYDKPEQMKILFKQLQRKLAHFLIKNSHLIALKYACSTYPLVYLPHD